MQFLSSSKLVTKHETGEFFHHLKCRSFELKKLSKLALIIHRMLSWPVLIDSACGFYSVICVLHPRNPESVFGLSDHIVRIPIAKV